MRASDSSSPVLILPGRGNSDPQHWQSLWEAANPGFQRVIQDEWERVECTAWQQRVESAVAAAGSGTVLAAHSLGCLLAVHWAAHARGRIRGALLVGVPDPSRASFPPELVGFAPVPMQKLPFASIVVASTNDVYGSWEYSRACAAAWGSRLVTIGAAGHINTASGFGPWHEGFALLDELRG
ncbi:MAG: RBBP9/YdeN family alpha/beta hydrolase [Steroidobacteraceae bacterium]